jgi:hypothetical protein
VTKSKQEKPLPTLVEQIAFANERLATSVRMRGRDDAVSLMWRAILHTLNQSAASAHADVCNVEPAR